MKIWLVIKREDEKKQLTSPVRNNSKGKYEKKIFVTATATAAVSINGFTISNCFGYIRP